MSQKSVIIFGGSRGIGRIVAEQFVVAGFQVTIIARTGAQVMETVRQLSSKGHIEGIVADVSEPEAVRKAVERHTKFFDGLDAAINAAGIQGPIGLSWENDPADWRRTLMANLLGCYNVSCATIPIMMRQRGGIVIFFSGGGAAYARPRFSAYGCSKTGVLRLAETIHEELMEVAADGKCDSTIRIYAVAPGTVKTQMTEEVLACRDAAGAKAYEEAAGAMERGGTPPQKAAELCLYLAEKRPRCLSGRLIHVNEPYRDYVARFEGKDVGDSGLLRRQSYSEK